MVLRGGRFFTPNTQQKSKYLKGKSPHPPGGQP